jgi:phosphoglucomutase
MSSALDRLKNLTKKISSYELTRKENIAQLRVLFGELGIDKKVKQFEELFDFKAINLSGVSLQNDDMGTIKEGKYLQILAISYDKNATKKSKNISLAYFGRVENVNTQLKDSVVEFVLRYRFEKSFLTLEHYNGMLQRWTQKGKEEA